MSKRTCDGRGHYFNLGGKSQISRFTGSASPGPCRPMRLVGENERQMAWKLRVLWSKDFAVWTFQDVLCLGCLRVYIVNNASLSCDCLPPVHICLRVSSLNWWIFTLFNMLVLQQASCQLGRWTSCVYIYCTHEHVLNSHQHVHNMNGILELRDGLKRYSVS